MVAFLAHAPGLYVLAGRTLAPAWVRLNVAALVATFLAMGGAGVAMRDRGQVGLGVASAWMLGHFAWSVGLAWGVLRGKALKDRRLAGPR